MVDKDSKSSGKNTGSEGGSPKRPSATIDMKAENSNQGQQKSSSKKQSGKSTNYMITGSRNLSGTSQNFFAGIAGGILVVFAFYLLQLAGLVGGPNTNDSDYSNLINRIAKVEKSAENNIKKQAEKAISSYQERLAQLENRITAIAGSANGKDGANIAQAAAITNLLTELETNFENKITSLRGQLETQISESTGQISKDLRKSLVSSAGTGKKSGNSDVMRQLLDNSTADLTKNIAQLNNQTNELAQAMANLQSKNTNVNTNISSLSENINQINLQIKNISTEFERLKVTAITKDNIGQTVSPISKKVSGLDKKLTSALEANKFQQKNTTRTALSIAFAGLKKAADRGEPFAQELETIKQIAPEYSSLNTLSKFELKGIASFKTLQKKFPDLLRNAIEKANEPESASILDKAKNTVVNLVKFRRKGNVSGDDAESVLARMEYHLNLGSYEKVIEESKALKGEVAIFMEDWVTQLDARLKLDETLQKIELALLSQLGSSKKLDKGKIN